MAFDPDAYLAKQRSSVDTPSEKQFAAPIDKTGPGVNALGPVGRFLIGAGRKVAETGPIPIARFLAGKGVPLAGRVVRNFQADAEQNPHGQAGDIGGVVADMGMLAAPTPFGKAGALKKILGAAAQGTAQHQAQNYGREGEFRPGEAALEMGLSTAVPYAGSKIGPYLKSLGVNSVRRGLGVSKTMMKGSNPPNIVAALEARKIPLTGGAERIASERGAALGMADDARGALLDRAGVDLNLDRALSDARVNIAKKVGEGSKGLTPHDEGAASRFLDDYAEQALRAPGYTAGNVSGKQAIQIRKGADKNARFIAGETPEGRNLASQEYRDAIEKRAMKAVESRNDPKLTQEYRKIKEEMRLDAPLLEAARDRAASQTGKLGLGTDLLIGGLGGGAAFANPWALAPAVLAIGARRALNSTGGGRLIYEGGRAADNTAVKKWVGRGGLNLGRSAYYGDSE